MPHIMWCRELGFLEKDIPRDWRCVEIIWGMTQNDFQFPTGFVCIRAQKKS